MNGPTYCSVCGAWPASAFTSGNLCHMCELRVWAKRYPVPLPSDTSMVKELAGINCEPAIERLKESK